MSHDNSPVLFISGAGLPAWIWDTTRRGAPWASTVAPRPSSPRATVGDHARAALQAIADLTGDGPVVAVAHSAGGLVATELCALAPERISAVLGVSAVIPRHGQSFTSCLPVPQRWMLPVLMRLLGTRPPEASVRKHLAAGVDDLIADRLVADLAPESLAYYRSRVREQAQAAKRGYIFSDDDTELPAALQQRFANRLAPSFIEHLPGGHLPMLLHPQQLQRLISSFLQYDPAGPNRERRVT